MRVINTAPTFISILNSRAEDDCVVLEFCSSDAKNFQVKIHKNVIGMTLVAIQREMSKLPVDAKSDLPITQFLNATGYDFGVAPDGEPLLVLLLAEGIELKVSLGTRSSVSDLIRGLSQIVESMNN